MQYFLNYKCTKKEEYYINCFCIFQKIEEKQTPCTSENHAAK